MTRKKDGAHTLNTSNAQCTIQLEVIIFKQQQWAEFGRSAGKDKGVRILALLSSPGACLCPWWLALLLQWPIVKVKASLKDCVSLGKYISTASKESGM